MGLLSKLRAWIGGESEPADGGDADDPDDSGDGSTGLDPSAATETRARATDDAVDALRDVRRSREAASADESGEQSESLAEDANESDRDAP
ncbi:hypothetical protein [Halorubrum sp. HHNYT27]|uniref:hypothetical protein n=1 Tax=Halorubrum sp. HHNYT27 TaxID=3402275 RepID=UPI003EBF3908